MYNRRSLDDKEAHYTRQNGYREYSLNYPPENATGASRLRVGSALAIIISSFFLVLNFSNLFWNSEHDALLATGSSAVGQLSADTKSSRPKLFGESPEPILNANGTMGERKGIVMSSFKTQDVAWVDELKKLSPGWEVYRYVPDASPSDDDADDLQELSVANPNGREALSYLTFITDYYATLPDIVVFNHGHPQSWHQIEPMVDKLLVLNLTAVKDEKYVNLRCQQNHGCTPESTFDILHPKDERRGHFIKLIWAELLEKELGPVPDKIARPCCAQFAVTKEAILAHPLKFWQSLREPLENRKPGDAGWRGRDDYEVGLKFEMFWHVLFGKEPVQRLETLDQTAKLTMISCPTREYCENVYFQGAIHCNDDGENIQGHVDFNARREDFICVNDLREGRESSTS